MKRSLLYALVILFLAFGLAANEKEVIKKSKELYGQKKYQEALKVLDQGIAHHGESEALMASKSHILLTLERPEDALKAAIRRVELAKRKSPWRYIEIVDICVKLKDKEAAFKWLTEAVNQGFLSYTEIQSDNYALLHGDKRFKKLVNRIKDNIGIGKQAKDFTITLLDGTPLTLSKLKGKVVLIDFWATWCPPCVKGIPHLKKMYKELGDKGLEIVGISLDSKKKALEDYMVREKLPWKVSYSGKGWFDPTAKYYKVNLIPSYWLIDRAGVLRNFGVPLRDKDQLKQAIKELLAH